MEEDVAYLGWEIGLPTNPAQAGSPVHGKGIVPGHEFAGNAFH